MFAKVLRITVEAAASLSLYVFAALATPLLKYRS